MCKYVPSSVRVRESGDQAGPMRVEFTSAVPLYIKCFVTGGMAERLKAHAWKACVRESVPWVRIPLSPPKFPGILRAQCRHEPEPPCSSTSAGPAPQLRNTIRPSPQGALWCAAAASSSGKGSSDAATGFTPRRKSIRLPVSTARKSRPERFSRPPACIASGNMQVRRLAVSALTASRPHPSVGASKEKPTRWPG